MYRISVQHAFCFLVTSALIVDAACPAEVDYVRDVKPVLKAKCYSCHGAIKQEANLRLDTVEHMRKGGDSGPALTNGDEVQSDLMLRVTAADKSDRMPPEGEPLSPEQIEQLTMWLAGGAPAPPNEQPQPNPKTHWAFQRLKTVVPPAGDHPIDAFIDRHLENAQLRRSQQTDVVSLIRRMFMDLHGLPPVPQQIAEWAQRISGPEGAAEQNNGSAEAVRALIDELLVSSRYGERWAQHWLDVVRYADTHGFEVNTPRPNAWPYRDYVIEAFNKDKPYDRFVFEQLAGDSVGEDAATGFMVAAAALLPGQIGKDEESKRLARQEELDEIIVGTTATFLGMTVGCARCHDHKFDPIPQTDYYAMQAFFAGVDYGDREIRGEEFQGRTAKADALQPRISELRIRLNEFEPKAFVGRTIVVDDEDSGRVTVLKTKNGHGTNPDGTDRGYRNDVGDNSRYGNLSGSRYTWWDNHADEDVFTWNPNSAGRFRLWISWGVHGSGVHTRDARYVLDADGDLSTKNDQKQIAQADQYYFSGVTEGESEQKPLWSGLSDAGVHDFTNTTRLILRGGETGTGITADVIVLQEEDADGFSLPRLRSPVSALKTVERFEPVTARFMRFTSFETIDNDKHQPCIDELEVFTAGSNPTNIALADNGTKASSSGNYSNTGKHQLKHINDGNYGNSYSWISNENGRGWVQLEFAKSQSIDQVEWARDREGKFNDRLSLRYRIDTSTDGQNWTVVAQSDDRLRLGTPHDTVTSLLRNGSSAGETDVSALATRLHQLETQQTNLRKPQLVFSGIFREPDKTFVLNRGDPEQPTAEIAPHVLTSIGSVSLPQESDVVHRRAALAKWITSPDNPLAARVMVNRIWQYHFGTGLVETSSDFGLNGASPSHPALLDWLAREFISNGWSVKYLHRLIMSSKTYQQASSRSQDVQNLDSQVPDAAAVDSGNRLLWRFPSRRLEAEAIRDCILQVCGQLNLKTGGPGFNFFKTRGGLSGFPPVEEFTTNEMRRMIYAHKIRMEPVPVFGAFDCPDAGLPTPRRSQSTTAIQALNLFNSSFVIDQADAFAKRVQTEAGESVEQQAALAFRLAVGRPLTAAEKGPVLNAIRTHGLSTLCRALFNSSEFLFIP
jgi:hypothetical protein